VLQVKAREADAHGYDKMPQEQRDQARQRDQIADNDNELGTYTSLVNLAFATL